MSAKTATTGKKKVSPQRTTLIYMDGFLPHIMIEFYGYVYAFKGGIPAFNTSL